MKKKSKIFFWGLLALSSSLTHAMDEEQDLLGQPVIHEAPPEPVIDYTNPNNIRPNVLSKKQVFNEITRLKQEDELFKASIPYTYAVLRYPNLMIADMIEYLELIRGAPLTFDGKEVKIEEFGESIVKFIIDLNGYAQELGFRGERANVIVKTSNVFSSNFDKLLIAAEALESCHEIPYYDAVFSAVANLLTVKGGDHQATLRSIIKRAYDKWKTPNESGDKAELEFLVPSYRKVIRKAIVDYHLLPELQNPQKNKNAKELEQYKKTIRYDALTLYESVIGVDLDPNNYFQNSQSFHTLSLLFFGKQNYQKALKAANLAIDLHLDNEDLVLKWNKAVVQSHLKHYKVESLVTAKELFDLGKEALEVKGINYAFLRENYLALLLINGGDEGHAEYARLEAEELEELNAAYNAKAKKEKRENEEYIKQQKERNRLKAEKEQEKQKQMQKRRQNQREVLAKKNASSSNTDQNSGFVAPSVERRNKKQNHQGNKGNTQPPPKQKKKGTFDPERAVNKNSRRNAPIPETMDVVSSSDIITNQPQWTEDPVLNSQFASDDTVVKIFQACFDSQSSWVLHDKVRTLAGKLGAAVNPAKGSHTRVKFANVMGVTMPNNHKLEEYEISHWVTALLKLGICPEDYRDKTINARQLD